MWAALIMMFKTFLIYAQEAAGVGRDGAGEFGGREVLLTPKVANGAGRLLCGDEGLHIDLLILIAYVEDTYSNCAVGERTTPNLDVVLL